MASQPVPLLGPRLAADVVAMAREGAMIRLDYTQASLSLVDRVIETLRREEPPLEAVTPVILRFGAYTGEVLVRTAGAVWVDFDTDQRGTFGQPFGIRAPDGRVWNPLGKALKRYQNGPEDSLRLFCLAVTGQSRQ
ncbi:hypothetical protein [Streptomyces sp. NBC_01476]|uniref:hypothetical protein n=1 Tax=Streptomyces sp. NBC_01476 TaxID=2903881 RepID=UPI002E315EDA|nr:hypothetical protein [Streptomyces sp. NBC_01476]